MTSGRWLQALCLLGMMTCAMIVARPVQAGLTPGDVNCDGQVDDLDREALIGRLFNQFGTCSNPDVNGDQLISVADVTSLLPLLPPPLPTATPTESPTEGPSTETPTETPTGSETNGAGTATPTLTEGVLPTVTRTPSVTRTGSRTRTPTRTATGGEVDTPTETATPRPGTPTRTRTASRTPTRTRTPTVTRTPSKTRPPTVTPTITRTRTSTRTRTVTRTPTITRTPSHTSTPTNTRPPTATRTATFTRTPSPTRTPTKPLPPGPQITFFGLATADNRVITPTSHVMVGDELIPVYRRQFGFGFLVVIEGRPGSSRRTLSEFGTDDFPTMPPGKADLWLISDRPLGNPTGDVCDEGPTIGNPNAVAGGVPAAASFDDVAAIDDFACRFVFHNVSSESCTFDELGNFDFVSPVSTGQFCSGPAIGQEMAFLPGQDTTLMVRLRDGGGNLGDIGRLIVSVE